MKIIVTLLLLALIGAIACKSKAEAQAQAVSSSNSSVQTSGMYQYYTKINWFYNNTLNQLVLDSYQIIDPIYQPFIDASLPFAFYPGEWEIGGAYNALGLGKYLYLSVSFLGEDGFSRYATAMEIGLDYFQVTKIHMLVIEELFV